MTRCPVLSIRAMLITLGALSILIAAGLAGFGLLGTKRQLDARVRIVMLERALQNHNAADAFMDDVRADVLRALLRSFRTNKEDAAFIRAELRHHVETVRSAITENIGLPLTPDLHDSYAEISGLVAVFVDAGQAAVELALTDPIAGSVNYEHFRRDFTVLETRMDDTRDVLHAKVRQVRREASRTARLANWMIVAAFLAGAALLALLTAVAVRVGQRITADLASSREEAHHLALHDALTGLPNRAFLAGRLEQDLAHARRNGTMLAMLCLDLDRFKQVNDTLGHPVGDALLQAVAGRLRDCLRQSDIVARLGGDEFAIVQAPLRRVEDAVALAQRIIEALSGSYDLDGQQVVIGASVGIALAPADTADVGELLKMADLALYRAKANGRGTFCLFEPGMDKEVQARRVIELDLRKAVAGGELELHYQPLVDLSSGRVAALEALARWRHPRRGLLLPGEFIPLAEETGLIVPLGIWALRQACADAAGWPAGTCVSVNVSAVQVKGPGLIEAVLGALAASKLRPERLELEITEAALLTDTDATLATLRELRALGVRIAMDDFGTGYSSLGYLHKFPFDKIKIDRSFVRDIETCADCTAIVRAVSGLGANLGIATVAEGVETLAQLDRIRAEGCDQVQGYYFSRPVPAADVAAIIDDPRIATVRPPERKLSWSSDAAVRGADAALSL